MAAEMLPTLAKVPAKRRHPLPALCRVGDGLQAGDRDTAAVLMNPPYGRVKLSHDERERFAHALYGHANLYGLFMAAGLDDLGEGGVLAALVPTSWTSGLYFRNLRDTLGAVAPLQDVTFVVERGGVFDDVLQETCLAVFSARRSQSTTIASMNGHVAKVGKVARPHGSGPWLLPRRSDDAPIAVAAAAMPNTLASSGWGVSTGPLVWNRRSNDLYPRTGKERLPVIWAADIDGGRLHRDPARDSMRYLRLRAGDLNTLVLDECALLVQRTTAPEQARRIVAAPLSAATLATWGGQVVVENHVNVLRPTALAPLLSQDLLTRLFASPTIDRVARCLSGSVALSAFELEALPLPDGATLSRWEKLTDVALEKAIVKAYRPQAS
jgi:adenine-specific DNA-methyltransferase